MKEFPEKNQYHIDDKGEIRCPQCNSISDGHTRISEAKEGEDNGPRPGSITICIECGCINIFTDEFKLRKMKEDEFQEIKTKDPETYLLLQKARVFILNRIKQDKRLNRN